MNASVDHDRTVVELIDKVRRHGGRLWLDGGELRYRVPKGVLSSEDVRRFGACRNRIVEYVQNAEVGSYVETELPLRRAEDPIPLTYSQLKYWHSRHLQDQPTVRTVASALRLNGPLEPKLLERGVTFLTERHDALRTRIAVVDGEPRQFVDRSMESPFQFEDVSGPLPEPSEQTIQSLIRRLILQPILVTRGPLFVVHLAKLGARDHLLIVAMEHIISDAFSLNLLLRELRDVYAQLVQNQVPLLPALPLQYPDYALWQARSRDAWQARHGNYWRARLGNCPRLRFPDARCQSIQDRGALAAHPIEFSQEIKLALTLWCRARKTTPAMSVFAAFAALVLRWCDADDAVFPFQTDGRDIADLRHTIGYCATVLHLRVQMNRNDTFTDLLARVTREYCMAYEHADHNHVAAQLPRPEFTRNSSFNWIPHGLDGGASNWSTAQGDISCRRVTFPHPTRQSDGLDVEPMLLLHDGPLGIVGNVYYPVDRFAPEQIARFAESMAMFMAAMLEEPGCRIYDIPLR